jgi:CheY-like chemotaxis protein/HPt (histidine-containing phosphotransfer) domain-containing protein
MTARERLLKIDKISYKDDIGKMEAAALKTYSNELSDFVDDFSKQEPLLRNALEKMNYDVLRSVLKGLKSMLESIGAQEIARECPDCASETVKLEDNVNKLRIEKFISDVTMLSIDIQVALYKDENEEGAFSADDDENELLFTDEQEDREIIILAVDDSPFLLNNLNQYLKKTDYKLVCAPSAKAAMKIIANIEPSLFIFDINMPEVDGYELAGMIQALGYTKPIIFLTGNADKQSVRKAILAGGSDFVVKPINKEQLLARIKKFV